MPLRSPVFTGLLLFAAQSSSVHSADENTLEEITVYGELSRYSALKSDVPIMETARSVSIESLQQIIDKGALVLDDTYTYSAGVTGETYGYATRGDWVLVRGLDVPQYQDSLQSLFGNYNNARPDIYTLEQVEILKGPASVLFGKGSPGGLINVISKRPQDEAAHEVQLQYGTFDRKQVAFDTTGQLGGENWLYRLIGVYRDGNTQVDNVKDKASVFAPSITWLPNDDTDVTLLLNYTDTESDTAAQFLPIAGTLLPGPNGERIKSDTYLGEPEFNFYNAETLAVTLLASHQFNATWSMEFTSRYTDGSADYQQAWPSFIPGDRYVYNTDTSLYENGTVPRTFFSSDADSEQTAFDVRIRAELATGAIDHSLLIGTQYQDVTTSNISRSGYALGYDPVTAGPDNNLGDRYWVNVFDPEYGQFPDLDLLTPRPDQDSDSQDLGLYISDQISFSNWRVTLGLRFDQSETTTVAESQQDDALSASAGILYQFENGLAPYASYAQSFDPVIGDNGAGATLDPQEGEQVEIGFKYQPERFPALITAAWFDLEQSNLSDPLSQPGEFEQQSGRAKIDGFEIEGMAQFGELNAELNLTRLNTQSPDGWNLASVPKDQASAWITWRPQGSWYGFRAGGGVRYTGASWDGSDQLKTPSHTLYDLMVGYELKHWDFSVNVRNLTDEDYYATCLGRGDCFPGDERTVVAQMRYRVQ